MKKIIVLLLCIFLLAGCTEAVKTEKIPVTAGHEMQVHFIDVGQGDSILIESPSGKTMLIDGGVKGAGQQIVSYLKELGIDKLDIVVATHPDADHIGGLIPVLDNMTIEQFYDSGKVHTSQTFEEMLTRIDEKNIPYHVPKIGDDIEFDKNVNVKVLNANDQATDNNDASIVLKMTYGNVSFLLTGDAGVALEKEMLQYDVKATVLKAGHHGSNTSSSEEFIQAVKPEVTILSYGEDNKYGHPHAEIVDRLQAIGSKIYATADLGTITVSTDGVNYTVNGKETSSVETGNILSKEEPTTAIEIVSKDLVTEIVGIKNSGQHAVSLKDWQLISIEGHQVYNFPNLSLQPGKTIYITSGTNAREGQNYLKWTTKQIWLNAGDAAQLRNEKGELVSELE
ncbi:MULTISPECIES: MBL fold metallo-hydrolase [Lysinibacillus]|uniref:MBL fold metallo-hydrolase n=1 Tax=Lysinibacillus capsici TaxID=2115968 RepID=A0ABY8KSR5_9BACI|nr:MBL fold metallo-hydrolase [Lysinibacillus capsici]MCT1541669.1 MBL fold metallo-hydrolase [Lysinibacillus capsici]MCT1572907.1 MBL fold metallo-hydrolase [Lysinibacillus capsici]MCT1648012.1 MBL fold metallo-hydrolase [Lysinibacillus capsici]MCT1726554.1 MBL fold metallo-hydrolase [Lysinibacillus capsici]MCT1783659.1 MBL fold metallo-hydrolase [Lysinibacillus capsici]